MQNRCIFVLLKWLWWINYMWRQVQAIGCLSPAEKFFRIKKRKLSIVESGENKVNSSALLSEQIEAGSETLDSQSKHLLLVLFSGRSVFVCCTEPFSSPCSKSQTLAICISIKGLWLWRWFFFFFCFFSPPVLVLVEGGLGGGGCEGGGWKGGQTNASKRRRTMQTQYYI